jgi:hypothetical protein
MSSVMRTSVSTGRNSQYYVNNQTLTSASGVTSDTLNEAGVGISIDTGDGLLIGAVVVRDMGKTVRLPVATGGGSYAIRTLRKVQRITQAAVTTTNDGVIATAAASPQYGVFYIVVGVNDDDGYRSLKWSSLNVAA